MSDDLDGLKNLMGRDDCEWVGDTPTDAEWRVVEAIEMGSNIVGRPEDTFAVEAEPFAYEIKYEAAPEKVTTTHYFGSGARWVVFATWEGVRRGSHMVYTIQDYEVRDEDAGVL